MAKKVKASYFSDKIGYRDNNLFDGQYWYAELSKDYKKKDFSALGNLPYKHKLKITYKGKSVVGIKGDVGSGGPLNPKIDLHEVLAKKINFPYTVDWVTIKNA